MAFPSTAVYRPCLARNVMNVEKGQNGHISFEKLGAWVPGFKKA
jgi:hypothetical protein